MPDGQPMLMALLREASRQSEPFQSLIHDYALDVMNDAEVHQVFTTRLSNDRPMLRRLNDLTTLFTPSATDRSAISPAMNEILEAVTALRSSSHTNVTDITNLVAVELAYRRMDQGLDAPPAVVAAPGD